MDPVMMSIQCLCMYNLDNCHPRIPCGWQIELFLSWIFNEYVVHPSLPHFLAFSGTLESRGSKSYSRPTSVILFWWEEEPSTHGWFSLKNFKEKGLPSLCWLIFRYRSRNLFCHGWISLIKIKQNTCRPLLCSEDSRMPAGHQNLGSNVVTAHFLGHCEWR